jgi:sigma-B regulation protein RsbU (phosphoserine phosphatase)
MMTATAQIPLFRTPPPLASIADIHAVSRPARTFTGDFWFTYRHEDRIWFAVGDVAGKGLNAALVMAMIQEELEHRITSCASAKCDPSTTMVRLHTFLRPLLPGNKFATAVIGWLRADGTLTVTNAGHCPPLVVRTNGTIEEIDSTGPVAGILPSPRWSSKSMHLERGDAIVLYSDGLTESQVDDDELGVSGLRHALSGRHRSARDLATRALAAARGVEDDLTVVVLRRDGS